MTEHKQPEYLMYRPELPLSPWEMLERKKVLPVEDMLRHLRLAYGYLKNTPGEHQDVRAANADDWIGWWIFFFEEYGRVLDPEIAGKKLLTLDEVAEANDIKTKEGFITANLFANGMEGHDGHRYAISYCTSILRKGFVGLLLDEHIAPGKPRQKHFLPLQLRLSMWAYYFSWAGTDEPHATWLDYISVIPDKPDYFSTDDYYDMIFEKTHALFHFVAKGDPHFRKKMHRNCFPNGALKDDAPWMVFSYSPDEHDIRRFLSYDLINTLSTTGRAEKLLGGGGEDQDQKPGS